MVGGQDLDDGLLCVGPQYTCGVRGDGSLSCWGLNDVGQLGMSDLTERLVPERVGARSDWAALVAGLGHTCATRTNSSSWCWGYNNWGQLGLGDTTDRQVPTRVGKGRDWGLGEAGSGFTCVVRDTGGRSLWCSGVNHRGQLCQGDTADRLIPTRVG